MTDWKRKLVAYLHDPPSKALDIAGHEQFAKTLYRQAGFTDDESERFAKTADWSASAADRFPFPNSQAAGLSCHFDGVRNAFHHPLGPATGRTEAATLPFGGPFVTADLAKETDQSVQPVIDNFGSLPDDDGDPCGQRWRARFFAHWRLWQKFASDRDYRFGFLPADTRLPDHTVWNHMQVVSALQTCANGEGQDAAIKAAFLKLQIGPVQEFIAQARSIRDLWSGSYLLSWLMAVGLKALSAEVGPDAVIYPSLQNQPLFDLLWRDELWNQLRVHRQANTVWQSLAHDDENLLTPNLPNVFFAVVPGEDSSRIARRVEEAIRNEWHNICEACWLYCDTAGLTADEPGISADARRQRFESQVKKFLSLSWQVTPWPQTLEEALQLTTNLPMNAAGEASNPHQRVQAVTEAATKTMNENHRDSRYYSDKGKTRLNSLGLGWSLLYALNSWALDAVRQTRGFEAWAPGGWETGTFNNKDSLNGRDEAVAGGREWQIRAQNRQGHWASLFKKEQDWFGAVMLVKRLWHVAYLKRNWDLEADAKDFPMPNTRGIATHDPFKNADEDAEDLPSSEKHFAVLAFDGDEIGKWVSGEKAPRFESQLAGYTDGRGNPEGSLPYFKNHLPGLLAQQRPVSPSYHLQFSEALTSFALRCARPIVEVFDGRLIYCGGDDVLGLLPADTALACAQALRMAFRGSPELGSFLAKSAKALLATNQQNSREPSAYQKAAAKEFLFNSESDGFLSQADYVDSEASRPVPFVVPGPAMDASVGIAIAHFKTPLQDVIRAARAAEKRAKRKVQAGGLGRSAVAVTLFKRSGETIEWGTRWNSGGIELYNAIAEAMADMRLSGKFPHRVTELLTPYVTQATPLLKEKKAFHPVDGFSVDEIIEREFSHAVTRQRGSNYPRGEAANREFLLNITSKLNCHLNNLAGQEPEQRLQSMIALCQTVAFANRTTG